MVCRANFPCERELTTNHFKCSGHGPLHDTESVAIVVFDENLKIGNKLTLEQFPSKKLNRGELSLARISFTTLDDIDAYVIGPDRNREATAIGASTAIVRDIRSIAAIVDGLHPLKIVRGVCVIDKVVSGDHDGHAAFQSCGDHDGLTPPQRGKLRHRIAADLAEKFDVLRDIADVFMPSAANTPSPGATRDAPAKPPR